MDGLLPKLEDENKRILLGSAADRVEKIRYVILCVFEKRLD
jgi:hypothetical protein